MVLHLFRLINGKDRLVIRNAKGGRIGNGVMHIQSTGSHFFPEEPGSELCKPPVREKMGSNKTYGAGKGTEQRNAEKQLREGERRTFSHDDYLIRGVLIRVYVRKTESRLTVFKYSCTPCNYI